MPATAPILVPLDELDESALPRDRAGLDAEPLDELVLSLGTNGLRQPIELWRLSEPRGEHIYGLISGFRRLAAFRRKLELALDKEPWRAIPAFIREPSTYAEAFAAMVEENEVRAELSPFEKGRIAVTAVKCELFPTIEEAVNKIFPNATGAKRSRLRSLARAAEDLDGFLTAPEKLSLRQCLRLADAIRRGYGELIRIALEEMKLTDHDSQWQAVLPIVAEAERDDIEDPIRASGGRPRRILRPRHTLTVRREMTQAGSCGSPGGMRRGC